MRKILSLCAFLSIVVTAFNSCKKNFANEQYTPVSDTTKADLATKITASVSGFITDENNKAVAGAMVSAGTKTATTDSFGYFKISSASLPKTAAFIKVTLTGYFNGYRTFIANQGKETFIRLQLIPKTSIGVINSSSGGEVTTSDGASITIPANSVVTASNSNAYTGTVHVAAHWLNPADSNLFSYMPGDLIGIDTAGYLKVLATFGMIAIELTDDAGNLLQIASGKQATLNFPIPASLSASAPGEIPLWYFDEANGLWKQQGEAKKMGSNYVGSVSHFSYWNCDIGYSPVPVTAQIVDSALNPIPNTEITITNSNSNGMCNHGYTDAAGFIYGMAPANANLKINVLTSCYNTSFSKNFITQNSPIDLGALANPVNDIMIIKGFITDCNNSPITKGSAIIHFNNQNIIVSIEKGILNFRTIRPKCLNSSNYIIVIDSINNIKSPNQPLALQPGINDIGTISICPASTNQFVILSIDGGNPITGTPTLSGGSYAIDLQPTDPSSRIMYVFTGSDGSIDIRLYGLVTKTENYSLYLDSATKNYLVNIHTGPIGINSDYYNPSQFVTSITEFGNIGGYISGNFIGTFHGYNGTAQDHVINCSFRVRRTQ